VKRTGRRAELVVAGLIAASAVGLALGQVPSLIRSARASLAQPSMSLAYSDVSPLSNYITPAALEDLRAHVPDGALYTVRTLPNDGFVTPVVMMWLLPRRFTSDINDAQWVILYYLGASSVKIAYRRQYLFTDGFVLLQVRR
jgi:hypothetical protein